MGCLHDKVLLSTDLFEHHENFFGICMKMSLPSVIPSMMQCVSECKCDAPGVSTQLFARVVHREKKKRKKRGSNAMRSPCLSSTKVLKISLQMWCGVSTQLFQVPPHIPPPKIESPPPKFCAGDSPEWNASDDAMRETPIFLLLFLVHPTPRLNELREQPPCLKK